MRRSPARFSTIASEATSGRQRTPQLIFPREIVQSQGGRSARRMSPPTTRNTVCMARASEYVVLAPIDVELFVSAGLPRSAFFVLPHDDWLAPAVPTFGVAVSTLASHGWSVDEGSGSWRSPIQHDVDVSVPHPYELGPIWRGANCWQAELSAGGKSLLALVDHHWADAHDDACDPGDELTSLSPWRWHVLGPAGSAVCGWAETPVLAASAAEAVLMEAGADIPERTKLRRDLHDSA